MFKIEILLNIVVNIVIVQFLSVVLAKVYIIEVISRVSTYIYT